MDTFFTVLNSIGFYKYDEYLPLGRKKLEDKTVFGFDDLFNGDYQPKSFSSSWMGGLYVRHRCSDNSQNGFQLLGQLTLLVIDDKRCIMRRMITTDLKKNRCIHCSAMLSTRLIYNMCLL